MKSLYYPLLVLILISLNSCSILERLDLSPRDEIFDDSYRMYEKDDYINHLNFLGHNFLKSSEGQDIKIGAGDLKYLGSMVRRIIMNNELLIKDVKKVDFHIIRNNVPFHFSLPNNSIVISLGLIKKYIRNEGDLVSIVSFELLRSSRSIYYYNVMVPTGSMTTDVMLKMMRLNFEEKKKINMWIYHVLKRSGYDPYFYLNWIQQMNKNSNDFIMMLGDKQQISWEEYELKSFLIGKRNLNKISRIKNNSSKEFYLLKNNLKAIPI